MRTISSLMTAVVAAAALLMLAACGKKENPEARALLDNATEAFNAGDYAASLSILDSIGKAYPTETTLLKEAIALRPRVIEQQTIRAIVTCDSLNANALATIETLKPEMKWVKNPRMIEGYHIYKDAYNPAFMNTTGIEARVSEIGQFYIVSSAVPSIKHTSITLTANGESARTPEVPYDGESNYRIGGSEVITFSPEQSDTSGQLAARITAGGTSPAAMSITFNAPRSKTIKLTPAQAKGIALAYAYSQAVITGRDGSVERQKLERTLEIARSQMARTADIPEE